MINILESLIKDYKFTGDLAKDSIGLLNSHGKDIVSEHTTRVAAQAKKLAEMFGEDPRTAETAGLLHDISSIVPNERRLELADALGVDVLEEERPYPFILHQKLSAAIAETVFGIKDERILSAIGCHTTLKKNAQEIDMILFVADKLQWDQNGAPPYLTAVEEGLGQSLKHAAYAFLKHLLNNKSQLVMEHPWTVEAYEDLEIYSKNI